MGFRMIKVFRSVVRVDAHVAEGLWRIGEVVRCNVEGPRGYAVAHRHTAVVLRLSVVSYRH